MDGLMYISNPPDGLPLYFVFFEFNTNGGENLGRFLVESLSIVLAKHIMSYFSHMLLKYHHSTFDHWGHAHFNIQYLGMTFLKISLENKKKINQIFWQCQTNYK